MVNLFRINDITRALLLVLLLCLIRLPFLLKGVPLTLPELEWMAAADKANSGFLLYRDIWNNQSFLAALIHQGTDLLFGRSHTAYLVIGSILLMFQGLYINHILNVNRILPERTYIPALCYIVTAHVFFDLVTLSPALIGMTFLLPALHTLFRQMQEPRRDEEIFSTGLMLGLAASAHFPYIIFLGFLFIGFLSYTGLNLRRYLLIISGLAFPFLIIALYFLFKDGWSFYKEFALLSYWNLPQIYYFSYLTSVFIFTVPFFLTLASFFKLMSSPGFVNYQTNCQRIMLWWLVFSVPFIWFHPYVAPRSLFIIIPPLAFFLSNYFMLIRRKVMADVVFLTFLGLLLVVNYGNLYGFLFKANAVDVSAYTVKEEPRKKPDEKILVLGTNKRPYYDGQPATPYFEWRLAQRHFLDLEKYSTLLTVYDHFREDMPDRILDPENRMPELFNKLPELASEYKKTSANTYIRNKKEN